MTFANKLRLKSSLTSGEIVAGLSNGVALFAVYKYLTRAPTLYGLESVDILVLAAIFLRLCAIHASLPPRKG